MGLDRSELDFVSGVSTRYRGKTETVGESAKEDVGDGERRPEERFSKRRCMLKERIECRTRKRRSENVRWCLGQ